MVLLEPIKLSEGTCMGRCGLKEGKNPCHFEASWVFNKPIHPQMQFHSVVLDV